jgi:glycine/D-amino acid oxidase-like deaminating enzyme
MREASLSSPAVTLVDGEHYDIVVAGAGCAGMVAALTAAIEGARVLLVESTDCLGGTSAWSAGTVWIPDTPHAAAVGKPDSGARALEYLEAAAREAGGGADARRRTFVGTGKEALAYLERHSQVTLRAREFHPDYLSHLPGATTGGRALEPIPFDGRTLGEAFALLRAPIPEFTVLGGMMVDKDDIRHLLGMRNSWKSTKHAMKLLVRHAVDRLTHARGTRLVMGNALVGRLLASLMAQRVPIALRAQITAIERRSAEDGFALDINQSERTVQVFARRLVLTTGGFNRHPARRAQWLPGVDEACCPGAPGHRGALHDLALREGAAYGEAGLSHGFWAPISRYRRRDGSEAVFPHFLLDRGKPGMVIVNAQGHRFASESTSYNLLGIAMQRQGEDAPCYLVTDREGITRYGLGVVRPGGRGLGRFVENGYLIRAESLDALAARLDVPAAGLAHSVSEINAAARTGRDLAFRRGETVYERANGDGTRGLPNPCLGPIGAPPFYAVRLHAGDIGAATGLRTDTRAQVLDAKGEPIAGIYACGNDMQSILNGAYAGPGITLGPALTFGYIAARHAVRSVAISRGDAHANGRVIA